MMRFVLAAVAAFALAGAAPALACGDDCPMHKAKTASAGETVAAADKAEKKDEKACACHDAKECKCEPGKCECKGCHAKHEKKDEQKKS